MMTKKFLAITTALAFVLSAPAYAGGGYGGGGGHVHAHTGGGVKIGNHNSNVAKGGNAVAKTGPIKINTVVKVNTGAVKAIGGGGHGVGGGSSFDFSGALAGAAIGIAVGSLMSQRNGCNDCSRPAYYAPSAPTSVECWPSKTVRGGRDCGIPRQD